MKAGRRCGEALRAGPVPVTLWGAPRDGAEVARPRTSQRRAEPLFRWNEDISRPLDRRRRSFLPWLAGEEDTRGRPWEAPIRLGNHLEEFLKAFLEPCGGRRARGWTAWEPTYCFHRRTRC